MTAIDWLFWWTGALLWGGFIGMLLMVILAAITAYIATRGEPK